jgi:tRNA pseudouridine55 synthase
MSEWEGVLPLWKEAGMTSHDCVSRIRRILKQRRVGHTGTLDPDVSGVLPLCLGRATRIVEYLQEMPKTYEAVMEIGYATDTEDSGGEVIEKATEVHLTENRIRQAFASFVGAIEQVPPMYSAVKVDGKRLYELARAGETVERNPRAATIYELEIHSIRLDAKYPQVAFRVTCSKGTYVRTLCADIGRKLGYPAVMTGLIRTASGSIRREQSITLDEVERLAAADSLEERVIAPRQALAHFPQGVVSEQAFRYALQGRKMFAPAVRLNGPSAEDGALVCLSGSDDGAAEERFIGIYRWDQTNGQYIPEKLFV